ncbi:MAG: hypothetical protein LBT00_13270 [Spirochaetaceae bacterium]|jgi:hypothetical protein|nr:hypothetical protein [Spirochaetaceae bacterium]
MDEKTADQNAPTQAGDSTEAGSTTTPPPQVDEFGLSPDDYEVMGFEELLSKGTVPLAESGDGDNTPPPAEPTGTDDGEKNPDPDPDTGSGAGEGESTPGKPQRTRISTSDPDVIALAALKRANPSLSTEEAVLLITKKGTTPPAGDGDGAGAGDGGKTDPTPDTTPTPTEIDALGAKIKEVREKIKAANEEYDFDKVQDLEAQKDELIEKRAVLRASAAQEAAKAAAAAEAAAAAAEAAFESEFNAAVAQTEVLYGKDFADTKKPLGAEIEKILTAWETTNDPRAVIPERTLLAAQKAAASLKISPSAQSVSRTGAASKTTAPAAQTAPAQSVSRTGARNLSAMPLPSAPPAHTPANPAGGGFVQRLDAAKSFKERELIASEVYRTLGLNSD